MKPWGSEEILEHNEKYVLKRLTMKAGCRCSLQYHEKKRETIYVLSGNLLIERMGLEDLKKPDLQVDILMLTPSQSTTIPALLVHRMEAKKEDCVYLEASTPELDDVQRILDDYGR